MKKKNLSLTCVVAIGVLFGFVACERLTVTEQPTAIVGTTTAGYPNIQAMINASLDEALIAADEAAARHAAPDPAYATLRSVLRRVRDANLATARALNLDPDSLAKVTEEEHKEIAELVEKDPALRAQIEAVTKKLEADYAAIPAIEVKVQPLDDKGAPVGESYTVASKNGVIDTGYTALTSQELLLLLQAEQEYRPERGFAIGPDWSSWAFGSGRPWPNRTVKFFFSSSLDPEDIDWMEKAMDRMEAGTGMRFTRVDSNVWNGLRWLFFLADYAKIEKKRLRRAAALATIGKRWQSYITMDLSYVDHEPTFNHEMGHLFGLLHEHQRYDRDTKVRVGTRGSDYDKLSRTRRSCFLFVFDCKTVTNTTHYDTRYDYNSVMHYESCRRPADRITLKNGNYWVVKEANKNRWGSVNGGTYFTPWDIYTIKRLYRISPNRRPSYTPTPGTEYPPGTSCPYQG